jgi:hypothetical protein
VRDVVVEIGVDLVASPISVQRREGELDRVVEGHRSR